MACIFKKILPEDKMRTREIGLIIRTKGKESSNYHQDPIF
jgi:hypothetical protein